MPTNIFPFRQDDWLPLLEDWAAQLRGADQRSVSNQKLEALLEAIHGCYLHFPTTYDYRQIFYRVRKCDSADGWLSLVDCLNPPLGSPNYGRASMPREPILYGSLNLWTALDEIDASEGDFVQVVGFHVDNNGAKLPFELFLVRDRASLRAYRGQGLERPRRTVLVTPEPCRGVENSDGHEAAPDERPVKGRDRV
jgi:hypothetical protein